MVSYAYIILVYYVYYEYRNVDAHAAKVSTRCSRSVFIYILAPFRTAPRFTRERKAEMVKRNGQNGVWTVLIVGVHCFVQQRFTSICLLRL